MQRTMVVTSNWKGSTVDLILIGMLKGGNVGVFQEVHLHLHYPIQTNNNGVIYKL